MLMLATISEDGDFSLRFFSSADELTAHFDGDPPTVWLTPEQASGDPNYWPEGGAFLAEVTPMRMEPEQVAVTWRAVPG